jgi:hypothetical protein
VGQNCGGYLAFCYSTGTVSGTESSSGLVGRWDSGSVICPILLILVTGVLLRFRSERHAEKVNFLKFLA